MGLAGKDDLHRLPGVMEEFLQALQIVKDQVGPLVGGEAPGKTDGQDEGVQHDACRHHVGCN